MHVTDCRYDITIHGVSPNRSKAIIFIFQIHIIEGLRKMIIFYCRSTRLLNSMRLFGLPFYTQIGHYSDYICKAIIRICFSKIKFFN